jgi:sugar phosphate permease
LNTNNSKNIPKRRCGIGALLGIGVLINYIDRIGLSVAAPQIQEAFNLTPLDMGILFSAFAWSYSLLQIPVGMVLDRFGPTTVGR